jgi:hypothetical protein
MAVPAQKTEEEPTWEPTQRRDFMRLPLEERRRHLAAQAEQMVEHYEQRSERVEREVWIRIS